MAQNLIDSPASQRGHPGSRSFAGLDERLPSIGALTPHRHPTVVGARVSGPAG